MATDVMRDPKRVAAIALFALIIGTSGFFNTFDLSSGKIASTTICSPTNGKCTLIYCTTTAGNGFSQAGLNCLDIYCNTTAVIAANGSVDNCLGLWCPTNPSTINYAEPACTSTVPSGFCYLQMTKTSISAFTSAVFTNIVSSSTWNCPTGITRSASNVVFCHASFDYDTGIAATIGQFRFHNTGGGNSAVTLQIGPSAALNSNETVSMQSIIAYTSTAAITWSFQVAVTGVAGSLNVGPGEADCIWSAGSSSGDVG